MRLFCDFDTRKWGVNELIELYKDCVKEGRAYLASGEVTISVFHDHAWETGIHFEDAHINLHEQLLRERLRNLADHMPDIVERVGFMLARRYRIKEGDIRAKRDVALQNPGAQVSWVLSVPIKELLRLAINSRKAKVVSKKQEEPCAMEMAAAEREDRDPECYTQWFTLSSPELVQLCALRVILGYDHEVSIRDQYIMSGRGCPEPIESAMSFLHNSKRNREDEEGIVWADSREPEVHPKTWDDDGWIVIPDPYRAGRWYGPKLLKMSDDDKIVQTVDLDWGKWQPHYVPTKTVMHTKPVGAWLGPKGKKTFVPRKVTSLVDGKVVIHNVDLQDIDNGIVVREKVDFGAGLLGLWIKDHVIREDFKAKPRFWKIGVGKFMAFCRIPAPWWAIKPEHWPNKKDALLIHEYHDRWNPGPEHPSVEFLDFRGWCMEVAVKGGTGLMLDLMERNRVEYDEIVDSYYRERLTKQVMQEFKINRGQAQAKIGSEGMAQVVEELLGLRREQDDVEPQLKGDEFDEWELLGDDYEDWKHQRGAYCA